MARVYYTDTLGREITYQQWLDVGSPTLPRYAFTLPGAGVFIGEIKQTCGDRDGNQLHLAILCVESAIENLKAFVTADEWRDILRLQRPLLDYLESIEDYVYEQKRDAERQ